MKKSFKDIMFNIVVPVIIIILAILSIVLPAFIGNAKSIERSHFSVKKDNAEHIGYALEDLEDINSFIYVNHFPNNYIDPDNASKLGLIEKINELTPATHGTLQFVVFNYDKKSTCFDKDVSCSKVFQDQASKMSAMLLYLPFAFDSAVIWSGEGYYGTYGKMHDYDVTEYNNLPNEIREVHRKPQPITIEVRLPLDKELIADDRYEAARVITVHYQAKRGLNFNNNIPIIGNPAKITQVVRTKFNTTTSFISIMVTLIFAFLCVIGISLSLKHLPILGIAISGLILLAAQFLSIKYTTISGKILSIFALTLLLICSLLACKPKKKNIVFNCWLVTLSLSVVNFVLSVILSLILPIATVQIYLRITYLIFFMSSIVFAVLSISRMSAEEFFAIFVALMTPMVAFYANYSIMQSIHPACWLLNISALLILWIIFKDFLTINKRNQLLTKNLKAEVAVQTKTLESALGDREMLISFISHDLRKSSITIDTLASNIMTSDNTQDVALASQIKDKNSVLLDSFSEISKYIKHNYSEEPFANISINELFGMLERTLKPDCEANGIMLNLVPSRHSIRGKKHSLLSVISNLIFNAIEHAECKNITLSAKKAKNMLNIYVHDDGKGIDNAYDIFSPYSTSSTEGSNMGLGLFIVKSEIENQNGTISYVRDNGSTFVISMLLSE